MSTFVVRRSPFVVRFVVCRSNFYNQSSTALHSAPLNSTTGFVADTARVCDERARRSAPYRRVVERNVQRGQDASRRARARERDRDLVEHPPTVRRQPRADQRHHLALQRVDARIGMRPVIASASRHRTAPRCARISRQLQQPRPFRHQQADRELNRRHVIDEIERRRSCRADRSRRRASATGGTRRRSAPA